jgi:hypothetical protein
MYIDGKEVADTPVPGLVVNRHELLVLAQYWGQVEHDLEEILELDEELFDATLKKFVEQRLNILVDAVADWRDAVLNAADGAYGNPSFPSFCAFCMAVHDRFRRPEQHDATPQTREHSE